MTHPHLKYSPNVFCDLGCCVLSNFFLRIWGVFWLSRIFIFFLRKEICALRSLLSFSVFFILVSTCWGNDLLPPHLCPPFHIVPPHLCPPFHIVPPPHLCPPFHIVPPPTCVLLSTLHIVLAPPPPLVSSSLPISLSTAISSCHERRCWDTTGGLGFHFFSFSRFSWIFYLFAYSISSCKSDS